MAVRQLRPISFGDSSSSTNRAMETLLKIILAEQKARESEKLTPYQQARLAIDARKMQTDLVKSRTPEFKNVGGQLIQIQDGVPSVISLPPKRLTPKETRTDVETSLDNIFFNDFTLFDENFLNPETGRINDEYFNQTVKKLHGALGDSVNKSAFNRAIKLYRTNFSTRFDKYLTDRQDKYLTAMETGHKKIADITSKRGGQYVDDNDLDEQIEAIEGIVAQRYNLDAHIGDIIKRRRPDMDSYTETQAKKLDEKQDKILGLKGSVDNLYSQVSQLRDKNRRVVDENFELKDEITKAYSTIQSQGDSLDRGKGRTKVKASPSKDDIYKTEQSGLRKLNIALENWLKRKGGEFTKRQKDEIASTFDIPIGVLPSAVDLPVSVFGKQAQITPFSETLGYLLSTLPSEAMKDNPISNIQEQPSEEDIQAMYDWIQNQWYEEKKSSAPGGHYPTR